MQHYNQDEIREFSGCLKLTKGSKLVAIFKAPTSMLKAYPSVSPEWEFSSDDIGGQIHSLQDFNANPDKPDLDPKFYEAQLTQYRNAQLALKDAF